MPKEKANKKSKIKVEKQTAKAERMAQHKQLQTEKKAAKFELKQKIKKYKLELAKLSKDYKKTVKKISANKKDDKAVKHSKHETAQFEYYEAAIQIKNDIAQSKYDFGMKYTTINWRLFRWIYGVKKEFYRVIWSDPGNTFKYLGIIVVVALVLALLCFGIDVVVNQYIN